MLVLYGRNVSRLFSHKGGGADKLINHPQSTCNILDAQSIKWYSQISANGSKAGDSNGFPAGNNANGLLWLGTHPSDGSGYYGHQLGFSDDGSIWHRKVSNGSYESSWYRVLTSRNSSVSKSGETLSVTINGTTQSLTNTNTWRGIQDNLTSTSTSDSLSAKQGYNLANGSARDNTKLPLSGGTVTGNLTVNKSISVGDNESTDNYYGISLYRNTNFVREYGIYFGKTAASGSGTHGEAKGIWATYFTTDDNYGWIFRHYSNGCVASISSAGTLTATKIVKSGGTSSQFLKADGSVDSNTYSLSSHTHSYLPLSGGVMSGNITGSNGGGSWGYSTTLKASLYKPTPADSGSYFPVIGGSSKNGAWSYGYIGSSDYSFFSWNKSDGTSNISIELRNTSGTIALTSDIPSTYTWSSITSKPDTATRWPSWSEVTDKPSTFTPSDHSHEYIIPTRYDSDAPSPKTKGKSLTFQFSYFDSDWWNVLNMRSYDDYNYLSSQILTPAGNPGSDVGYGDMYWREGRRSTWIAKRKVLDDVNSSVSGGGSSLGSSLTVKIGGTVKTLSIPSTIAWSSLTSVPSSFTPSSHEHSRLKSEYDISDHLDKYLWFSYRVSASTSGTPATTDNSNAVLTINRHDGHYDSQIGFGSDGRIKYRSYSAQAISDNVTKAWNTLAYTSEIPTTMAWSNITSKPDSYTPSSHTHSIIYERSDARDQNPTPSEAALVCGRGFYMDFVNAGGPSDQGTYSAGFFINPWNAGGYDWSGGGIHELRFNQNGKIYHRVGNGSGWGSWETLITTSFALTNSEIDNIIT